MRLFLLADHGKPVHDLRPPVSLVGPTCGPEACHSPAFSTTKTFVGQLSTLGFARLHSSNPPPIGKCPGLPIGRNLPWLLPPWPIFYCADKWVHVCLASYPTRPPHYLTLMPSPAPPRLPWTSPRLLALDAGVRPPPLHGLPE